jgi:predicted transcriptional regulator
VTNMVGADELEGLRRAESQQQVFICLVDSGEAMSSQEIASKLNLTVNAVNIALFNLKNKGLVDPVSRGVYRYKLGPVLVTLLKEYFSK